MKILPRGASKYTPPPPLPEKCLLVQMGGGVKTQVDLATLCLFFLTQF